VIIKQLLWAAIWIIVAKKSTWKTADVLPDIQNLRNSGQVRSCKGNVTNVNGSS